MTSADVKFSIDDARAQKKGWGYLDAAIKNITTPNASTVVFHLKFRWAPFVADIALFANGIIPKNFAGQTRTAFYKHPIGTGPFMWDKRVVGQSVTFKRNPNYWQKGKPYLDSVTWTFVTDENTRELQLRGGQIQVDEFPPFNSINKLKNTTRRHDVALPVDADRLPRDERAAIRRSPTCTSAGRSRTRSTAQAIIKSVLFGYGMPANSFLPPQVPFYDPKSPGPPVQHGARRRPSWRSRSSRRASRSQMLVGAGAQVENAIGQIIQSGAQAARHHRHLQDRRTRAPSSRHPVAASTSSAFSYWTMDIADPDELVTFAIDPAGGAHSFYTRLQQPDGDQASRTRRSATSSHGEAPQLYAKIQRIAAHDAFQGFLYYSPYRWAYTSKLHGFLVQPLGNYHLEDAWLG